MRTALFLLAVTLLVGTATPTAWGHGGSGDHATREAFEDVMRSDPSIRARRVDAHLIEEWHERHGHERWARGRGDWGHSWSTFKAQARRLREYLLSQSESVRRFALVMHWAKVADCESSGNWTISTGNGYYGGLQFSLGTWRAYGGEGMPHHQPAWYQAEVADRVRTRSGLHHWPVCGRYYR